MKTGRWLAPVALLVFVQLGCALETMAYRFAVEPDCIEELLWENEIRAPKIVPESCFLGEGEELVDLGGWFREAEIPLKDGWVIWNRSRRLLVVHALMFEQWQVISASGFDRQPKLLRVSLEWFRGVQVLNEPPPGRQADTSLVIVGRSGLKAVGELQGGGDGDWRLVAEVEPTADLFYEVIDGRERVEEAGKTPDGKKLRMGMRVGAFEVPAEGE